MPHPTQFRALDMLLNEHTPMLHRRSPYWAPRPPKMWREAHVPAWNWTSPAYSEDDDVTALDTIASYVSAASSAAYAHGELKHTGPLPGPAKLPGYYLIDAHSWQDTRIVSPLGTGELPARVWVAYPTLEVLQKLTDTGYWPGVTIHDSWTCADTCRLREWATAVNVVRATAWREYEDSLADGTDADQDAALHYYEKVVKSGYAVAFQLMLGTDTNAEKKSKIRRPDWYHTTLAQAAANVWRKTWRCVEAGYAPLYMGAKDEVWWLTQDVIDMTGLALKTPLLKMDPSGVQLGAWKVKPRQAEEAIS